MTRCRRRLDFEEKIGAYTLSGSITSLVTTQDYQVPAAMNAVPVLRSKNIDNDR